MIVSINKLKLGFHIKVRLNKYEGINISIDSKGS